jgi:triacylglycerol lipase
MNSFLISLALELASMIEVAYAQYAGSTAPLPVALQPLVIEETLTVHENGKQVPFGFIASRTVASTGQMFVFVVIRGTESILEWLDDGFVVPCAIASFGNTTDGYEALYRQLSPQIVKTLKRLGIADIIVTGHSLGAALAQLAQVDIWNNLQVRAVSYTFCGPRCGDLAFAKAFAAAGFVSFRIFNTEDLVPTLPPATTDLSGKMLSPTDMLFSLFLHTKGIFEHVGKPVPLTFNLGTIAANHDIANVIAELAK